MWLMTWWAELWQALLSRAAEGQIGGFQDVHRGEVDVFVFIFVTGRGAVAAGCGHGGGGDCAVVQRLGPGPGTKCSEHQAGDIRHNMRGNKCVERGPGRKCSKFRRVAFKPRTTQIGCLEGSNGYLDLLELIDGHPYKLQCRSSTVHGNLTMYGRGSIN
jgi:hypothetical protein